MYIQTIQISIYIYLFHDIKWEIIIKSLHICQTCPRVTSAGMAG